MRIKTNQRGTALIIVIGVLSFITPLLLAIMGTTRTANLASYVNSGRELLRYDNESHATEALWNYLWDRKIYPGAHQRLGNEVEREENEAPWLADGMAKPFSTASSQTTVWVSDAQQGLDLTSSRPGYELFRLRNVNEVEDEDLKEKLTLFTNSLDDYIDYDDRPRGNGFEYEEYDREGLTDFPANGNLLYREELYWLPEAKTFLQGRQLNLIPPRRWRDGVRRNSSFTWTSRDKKPNLFAAGTADVAQDEELTPSEIEELQALRNGELLWQDLSPDLQQKLSKYSRSESGITSFLSRSTMYNNEVARQLIFTVNSDRTGIRNRDMFIYYWEFLTF